MSKERQRARAARQEARRREVEAAAATRARQARQAALRSRLRPSLPPRRRRRFGSLSTRARAQLVTAFLAVQVVAWQLLPGLAQRAAFAVLTLACLAVIVRTRRSPSR